jgi:starch synthase
MLVALEDIARTSKNDVFLIMSGWFQDKYEHELFSNELKRLAPTIKVCLVDGRNKLVQEGIWHAADIFTSLSDNIQETFGITPIEAMATGLPVVISDWNGYKDTVRKGVDGFMVETVMPLNGEKFSQYYQSNSDYMKYVGLTSQVIGVSVNGCIDAYKDLINNKELRLQMGKNAQDNAKQFDWSYIIPKYQELWKELSDIRKSSNHSFTAVKPCYEDPFVLFGSYPTINLSYNHIVRLVSGTNMDYLNYVKKSPLVGFIIDEGAVSPKQEDIELIYSVIMDYLPHCINEFESKMTKEQYDVLLLNLSWLYKMGLIEIVNSELKGS